MTREMQPKIDSWQEIGKIIKQSEEKLKAKFETISSHDISLQKRVFKANWQVIES